MDRLEGNPARDEKQAASVEECGKHFESLVTVGSRFVRRCLAHTDCQPAHPERGRVGDHVVAIREERQRSAIRPPATPAEHEEKNDQV